MPLLPKTIKLPHDDQLILSGKPEQLNEYLKRLNQSLIKNFDDVFYAFDYFSVIMDLDKIVKKVEIEYIQIYKSPNKMVVGANDEIVLDADNTKITVGNGIVITSSPNKIVLGDDAIVLDADNTQITVGSNIVLDAADEYTKVKVVSGENYVEMTPSGLRGVDSILGTTFYLPTDGSAPEFSSGIIKEAVYEIYTSGVIKTADDPTATGGLLINNIRLAAYDDTPTKLLEFIYDGSDKGDAYIGDYDNDNHGIKYDHSSGTLSIRGSITITGGTTPWSIVSNDNGNKPVDNADVTGSNTSADTNAVAGTSAATVRDNAANALANAATALNTLSDIASDTKITPVEKLTIKPIWDAIVIEGTATTGTLPAQATLVGVADTDFDTAFAALDLYLNTTITVFSNMTETTTITRSTWDTVWKNYYDERTRLINAIANAVTAAQFNDQPIPFATTPSGAGLYLGGNYLGYYDSAAWKTYMDSSGNFYLGGSYGKLQWNGSVLTIEGAVTITGGSGISNLADAGALATQDPGDVNTSDLNNDAGWTDDTTANTAVSNAATAQAAAEAAQADADTAQNAADDAQSDATSALNSLSDIASDAKITPVEKLSIKPEWDAIVTEGTPTTGTIPVQATAFGISDADFDTAYANLYGYLITTLNVFGNMAATTDINRTNWNNYWKAYYDERTDLLNAIAAKAKSLADTAQDAADVADILAKSGGFISDPTFSLTDSTSNQNYWLQSAGVYVWGATNGESGPGMLFTANSSNSFSTSRDGNGQLLLVPASKKDVFTIKVRIKKSATYDGNFYAALWEYDEAGAYLYFSSSSILPVADDTWETISTTLQPVQSDCHYVLFGMGFFTDATVGTVNIDSIQINSNADLTADQFTNDLSTIDSQIDRAELAFDANGNLITSVLPDSDVAPPKDGLFLGANYLGYYFSGQWRSYFAGNGDFALGTKLQFDYSTALLALDGSMDITGISTIKQRLQIDSLGTLRSNTTGNYPYLEFSNSGLQLKDADDGGTYGTAQYGIDKYGFGATVWIMNAHYMIPWMEVKEPINGDGYAMPSFRLYNRSSDPSGGSYETGDICVVNGLLKIYVSGSWVVVGEQTTP